MTEISRRELLAMAGLLVAGGSEAAGEPRKVLRIAFSTAETGFDPAQVSDLYSRSVTPHIFEGLYRYDHLFRPFKLRPQTAAAMPEISADFRTWTFRLRPGIFFSEDPAFGGKRRELTAQDYVYSWQRLVDPAVKSPTFSEILEQGIVGLEAARAKAADNKLPFDYDAPIEGLRALDRHTLQVKLQEPRPRFIEIIAQGDLYGAVAREVVEAAGSDIAGRPVGTGPYMLKEWRRSSFIALERNPGYREDLYDEQPAEDDAEGQALLARFKGRRLPMIDRVEISIIDEDQPRWLAFLNRQIDMVEVPLNFAGQAVPNGKLAPNLAKQGVQLRRVVAPDMTFTYFNMDDPTVGGYTPEKVALRRAIGLAMNVPREIETMRRGQAIQAQAGLPPHTYGYDPSLKTENGDYDPARAKALLDLFGYRDSNGDGWREMPDGRPLLLKMGSTPDQLTRQLNEIMEKSMSAVGLRMGFEVAQWPEHLKAARAGKLMMWYLGVTASQPDGQDFISNMYSPQIGGQNYARFRNEAYDRIFSRMSFLPDGDERLRLFREEIEYQLAYMPYKIHVHRVINSLMHAGVSGYRKPLFGTSWWAYVDREPPA